MAKKNKLTLAIAKKVAGVGVYIEVPVKFQSKDGEAFEGEVLVKRLSHNERLKALDVWAIEDKNNITIDQVMRAYVFTSIYSEENEPFFPDIESTGDVSPEFMNALYTASEKVNDYSGKMWISNQKNSGASLSSTESVDEPSMKQSKT
ncbi:hypothetical protein G9F32_03145 [Acinetobacter sp. 194]|uniref:phage tail assembly chaperone family protein, TAC n=1 Tax=Acinetobacter shaoyimingii TaxID=2715164 RepID=UPI00140CD0DD|nr:phage tail assembly chaperone family protein, TAC [Acinetobacter shaoyimingii]NHB57029.1 hypothetical protein [Acinetobacter shaoyimingii]